MGVRQSEVVRVDLVGCNPWQARLICARASAFGCGLSQGTRLPRWVYRGFFWIATTLVVISMFLLELKGVLEGLSKRVPPEEILTFTKFLLLTAVILPVLPRQDFGPFHINPFKTWMVVVAVSTVSYGSYVLQRLDERPRRHYSRRLSWRGVFFHGHHGRVIQESFPKEPAASFFRGNAHRLRRDVPPFGDTRWSF